MMRRYSVVLLVAAVVAAAAWSGEAQAGMRGRERVAGEYGGDYNIIVREVKVTPARAHVGDPITIEMVVENHGDLYNASVPAEIRANGRLVARRLVSYGAGGEGGRVQTGTFRWETKGVAPGEYRIRGEVFVWNDTSEFDNFLDVKEPVVLLPPGAAFPDGKGPGGTVMARDPRYKPHDSAAREVPAPAAPGGY